MLLVLKFPEMTQVHSMDGGNQSTYEEARKIQILSGVLRFHLESIRQGYWPMSLPTPEAFCL